MAELTVTMTIKQKLWFTILFKVMMFLYEVRLVKDEHVLNVVNHALSVGAFKTKVGNNKWKNLKINQKFEFTD